MSEEIDELLEDEYAAQQMEIQHIHSSEVNSENENKVEMKISALLIDISETLRLLNEQMIRLNEVTKILPETVVALGATTEAIQCISNELPAMVREQCLEEYKKIFANAVENYNQMQKNMKKRQEYLVKKREITPYQLSCFIVATQILLLLNVFLK